jgi:hypothetical protein
MVPVLVMGGWRWHRVGGQPGQVAPYGFVRPMEATLHRAAEVDPVKGATRPATKKACTILWDGKDAILVEASSMRKLENRSQTGRK